MSQKPEKLVVLVVLDGWGLAPPSSGNAIALANTPVYDNLLKKYPYTQLKTYGKYVGLPPKQKGNSEAGHMNMGAGRIVAQDAVMISQDINSGIFFRSPAFLGAIKHAREHNSAIHLMGLLTEENSGHAYPEHLFALLTLFRLKKFRPIYLHLFTDGRDCYKFAAIKLVRKLKKMFLNGEKIITLIGRFYAMDRNKNWKRTEKAYNAMVLGEGLIMEDPEKAILNAYNRGEYDEFILPNVLVQKKKFQGLISDNDAVIFFNLRSDRARQLTKPFVQKDFEAKGGFHRKKVLKNLFFVALTDFGPDLDSVITAYPSKRIQSTLPMILGLRMTQLYIAESEKYAHVTYFFNGGYANPVAGEDRVIIPSPNVARYDSTPQMSTKKLSRYVCSAVSKWKYNFILVNFASPDMIAHTGNLSAGIRAVEIIDKALFDIVESVRRAKGTVIITADHGNIEEMINESTGHIDTEHSIHPVPFILVKERYRKMHLRSGILADVAPTILKLFGIDKPKLMTGKSLIE